MSNDQTVGDYHNPLSRINQVQPQASPIIQVEHVIRIVSFSLTPNQPQLRPDTHKAPLILLIFTLPFNQTTRD